MQKVLITGASGFVGFHLVSKSLEKGLDVTVAVRKTSNVKHLQHLKLQYTYPDFTNVSSLFKLLDEQQYDFVIHAAGITKARNAEEYNRVNATYTNNLVEALNKEGTNVKRLIFMSSLGAIGPLPQYDQLITEDTPPAPVTAYGRSKLLAEKMIGNCKVPLVVLRPTAVYGPREKDIFIILKTIAKGMEPYIGSVSQQLSFVCVKDLAELTVQALFSEATGTYNITDGHCYDRYQLADIVKRSLGRKTFKFHIPAWLVANLAVVLEKGYGYFDKTSVLNKEKLNELCALNWCCDISKAQNELSFSPAYDLQRGIEETLNWYKENKWL